MIGDSFEFRGINFLEKFNMKVVKVDYILPPKRERKIQIPRRSGRYDYGSECWEERIIRIECDILKPFSRAELREISMVLGSKGKLYLWDEPDKFYVGEIYDGGEIFEFPKANIRTFTLEFICEPFAYRETSFVDVQNGLNKIEYQGTFKAPCQIILESEEVLQNITINTTYRRK